MGVLKAKRNGQQVAYRLDKAAVIVGSGENCNIRVPDAGLVTRHCQILKMENGYVLRDMSGEVGTFVNGKKVKEHLLTDRDLIQVGKERFTFSESAGENTARVAVSVAPPAAKPPTARVVTGNTSRRVASAPPPAAVAPARSGNTGRVAAHPPAAVEVPGRSTQRVDKGTQKVQKTTGRLQQQTGGTKKITARTAAGMGYQTSRSTFAMPSTKKGKLIAVGGVLFILALGGVMYAIKAGQVDPEKVKATMAAEIKELQKLKPDQVVEIDNGYEAILAEHEPVQKYVAQMYSNIDKEHKKVHQLASDLKKAMKDVNPFFAKYAALKAKPAEYKTKVRELYDECKSLNDSYGATILGVKLTEILTEVKKFMEENKEDSWEQNIVALQGEVRSMANKGEFAPAAGKINEFGEKFKEKEKPELWAKLKEQREFLDRQAPQFVNKEVQKGQKEVADGTMKKDEFKKKLEGYKAGLEGYKAALEKLEAAIAAIK
jgi:pSer/pThr/pTyr-binding forkhead associated (FHA) protein/uncharacterized coiled-coil DUF342 family protein